MLFSTLINVVAAAVQGFRSAANQSNDQQASQDEESDSQTTVIDAKAAAWLREVETMDRF